MKQTITYLILLLGFSLQVACRQDSNDAKKGPAPASQGAQGGADSGGGNYVQSTEEQIKNIFDGNKGFNLKAQVKEYFKMTGKIVSSKLALKDVEPIYRKMLGPEL